MGQDSPLHHISSADELTSLLDSTQYVAVDFYADWCPPCKAIAPVFEKLATAHGVPSVLAFAKVNVDHVGDVAQKYGITAMPTFLFFKDGKQMAVNDQKMIRGADVPSLTAAVEKLGGLAAAKEGAPAG